MSAHAAWVENFDGSLTRKVVTALAGYLSPATAKASAQLDDDKVSGLVDHGFSQELARWGIVSADEAGAFGAGFVCAVDTLMQLVSLTTASLADDVTWNLTTDERRQVQLISVASALLGLVDAMDDVEKRIEYLAETDGMTLPVFESEEE